MEWVQLSPWGGELRQLIEDLKSYLEQHSTIFLLAGSEKTLPILQNDLQESGIPCKLAEGETEWLPDTVYLRTGSLVRRILLPRNKSCSHDTGQNNACWQSETPDS